MNAAWSGNFEQPAPPCTERIVLQPLGEHVAELDFAAIMGSRVRLRAELQWGGGWPAEDFTLEGLPDHVNLVWHRSGEGTPERRKSNHR